MGGLITFYQICLGRQCAESKDASREVLKRVLSFFIDTLLKLSSFDYLFHLAVEMKRLGLPWVA